MSKRCNQCHKVKENNEFAERPNHNKTGKVYLHGECKQCAVDRMKEWREKNRAKFDAYQRAYQKRRYYERKKEREQRGATV